MMFTVASLTAACGKGNVQLKSGLDLANLDTTVSAGADFYQFANGGWRKANPLTAEYSRFGTMDKLANQNSEKMKQLVEEIAVGQHENGSNGQKVADLFNMIMDSVKLNNDGIQPIQGEMQQIAALQSKDEVPSLLAKLSMSGIGSFFSAYVYADEKQSDINTLYLHQGGLSMNDRDYYLKDDENSMRVRNAFMDYVKKLALLAGADEAAAEQTKTVVMKVETALAQNSRSREELRDPVANYNKMTLDELKAMTPGFDWDAYLAGLGLTNVKEMVVGQPEALQAAAKTIGDLSVKEMITYLQWKLTNSAASCLSDEFSDLKFGFYSTTMRGIQQQRPRWKRAISVLDGSLGEVLGQLYVEKYFPASSKERMVELVKNLQTALGERIDNLSWMSDETKKLAREKLATFHVKVGYPDKWKDYSSLDIKKDSYWQNMVRSAQWEMKDMFSRYGKPVDKEEWLMTPQTVNAYYNPSTNEICFPAGILQYPCFEPTADDAFNYGAIGVIIGHEMTHGFDDQGRQYDKDGNLQDWWTAEDAKRFNERADVMVAIYDSIEVLPGLHAKGRMTLGENIADHGGLKIAYQAFKNATKDAPLADKDGFSPEQRFFLSYAGVWAGNIREEEIRNRNNSDVHSLAVWRVNAALPQIDAWYEAFNITEKDPMYVAPENRANVW